MNPSRLKIILVLGTAGVLGGIAPIFMKIALKEFTPVEITFTRFFFALLILFPIALFHNKLRINGKDIVRILSASLLFSGNVFLFVFGLQYTTSVVSQLMYLLSPTLVIILSSIFLKTQIKRRYVISIIAGLLGGVILLTRSGSDLAGSLGTPLGNGIILIGVCSWSTYVIVSKGLSGRYSPLTLLVANNVVASVIGIFILSVQHTNIMSHWTHASAGSLFSLSMLVMLNSILFFFLYQWGIKLASPFVVSMSAYLSPLAAALLAVPLFGEQITLHLVVSAILIGVSSYLTFRKK